MIHNLVRFLLRPSAILGIDLGSSQLSILQLSQQQSGFRLDAFAQADLPSTEEQQVSCLRSLLKTPGFRSKRAVLAIPDALTLTKTLRLSRKLQPKEVAQAVAMDLAADPAVDPSAVQVDYQILGPDPQRPELLQVAVVLARTDALRQRVDWLRCAGLTPLAVDLESLALQRGLSALAKDLTLGSKVDAAKFAAAAPSLTIALGLALKGSILKPKAFSRTIHAQKAF